LVDLTNKLSKKIDAIMQKNCLINFGVAYLFNKLWRSIDSIQQVMMLSLTNVTVEGNINLLYYVVQKYSNKEFQCSDDPDESESSSVPSNAIKNKRELLS
jgi:hypothetical protein